MLFRSLPRSLSLSLPPSLSHPLIVRSSLCQEISSEYSRPTLHNNSLSQDSEFGAANDTEHPIYVCSADYSADGKDELSLTEGNKYVVLERNDDGKLIYVVLLSSAICTIRDGFPPVAGSLERGDNSSILLIF